MAVVVALAIVIGAIVKVVVDRNSGPDVQPATSVVATIPVSDTPIEVATAPDGTVYVANYKSGTVSVISEDRVTATLPVGKGAGPVVVATDGTLYAVGWDGAGNDEADEEMVIHVVRGNRDVATIRPDCYPFLAAGRNGQIYCSGEDSILVIEGDKVVDSISTVADPRSLAVAPDGTLYAESQGDTISTVTNGQARANISVKDPQSLAVGPDGTLYATPDGANELVVIRDGVIANTIPITPPAGAPPVYSSEVAVGPDGTVYVLSSVNDVASQVSVIQNGQVIRTIRTGLESSSLAVAPDGTVYVTNAGDNTVSVLR